MKVGFIGCGNLGSSLIKGFLNAGALRAGDLVASDASDEKLGDLGKFGIETTTDNKN